jgi:hypothetical protein
MSDVIQKIKHLFQKISKPAHTYNRKILKPSHDWMIIFTTTLFAILICAIGAYYFYGQVDDGKFFATSTENVENEVKINTTLLNTTVADINAREEKLSVAKQGSSIPSDPSK